MVPNVWFPPATPLTLQVTDVFEVPVTAAVNCAVAELRTVAVAGLTVTVISGGVTVVELVEVAAAGAVPPQDVIKVVKTTAESKASPIPNVRTFIPRPQQSRDVGRAALVGRPLIKRLRTPANRATRAEGFAGIHVNHLLAFWAMSLFSRYALLLATATLCVLLESCGAKQEAQQPCFFTGMTLSPANGLANHNAASPGNVQQFTATGMECLRIVQSATSRALAASPQPGRYPIQQT
jgi:hypothetical protein